jgi:hypothetical protein
MNTELAQGNLGTVGKYDLEFKEGSLVLQIDADMVVGSAGLVVKVDSSKVLDALAKAIPGTIDDAVFAIIKTALAK